MKQFLKVSLFILLAQIFLQDASFSMDTGEGEEHQEITFSAHQCIFHSRLEKLKKKITKHFPSVFIMYGWGDKEHERLVAGLNQDLKYVGFKTVYDLDVRLGGTVNIHTHADQILEVDKVVVIGSSELKIKYAEEEGMITEELDLLRTRIRGKRQSKLPTGVIPIWFEGDIKDNFPESLIHLPARPLPKKSIFDTNYFTHFFELLMDIFDTEEGGEEILGSIQHEKKNYIRQSKIPEETLRKYGQLYLQQIQEQKDKDEAEVNEALFRDFQSLKDEKNSQVQDIITHPVTIENSFDTLIKRWGGGGKTVALGYLPEADKSFIETTSEGCEESYLVQLGNKLHQSRNHQGTKLLITGDRQKIAVTGMGGIGKTTLALAYAHLAATRNLYEVIHWIKAEETSLYHQSYIRLLKALTVPVRELEGIEDSATALSNALQDKKYLLIYDNVESPGDLQDILPQGNKGHIIITSRHDSSGWDETLEMDVFSEKQAVEYIFERVKHLEKTQENEALAQKIAKKLEYLPLALSQMTSYINNTQNKLNNPQEGLQDYIIKLKARPKTILSYEDPKRKIKGKEKTKRDLASIVYTTWDITLNELSPLSRQLMPYLAYLGSDDIPIDLFRGSSLDCNDEEIEEALDELKRYSMIKRDGDYVSLHRLVQKVGRLQQAEKQQEKETIEALVKLFVDKAETLFNLDLDNPDGRQVFLSYAPHMAVLFKKAANHQIDKEWMDKFSWESLVVTNISINVEKYSPLSHFLTEKDKKKTEGYEDKIKSKTKDIDFLKEKPTSEGSKWLNDIIRQGHRTSQYFMGEWLYYMKFYEKAVKFYQWAADQDHEEALLNLGLLYCNGQGVEKNYELAEAYFEKSANLIWKNAHHAQYLLGIIYSEGMGGLQNDQKAFEWYKKAADQGHQLAQHNLGNLYNQGRGVKQDYGKAIYYFELAVAPREDLEKNNSEHTSLEAQETILESEANSYEAITKRAQSETQYELGLLYSRGEGVSIDHVKAKNYFKCAADQGHAKAQCYLGKIYLEGIGRSISYPKALKYLKLAADQGIAEVHCGLGAMYQHGHGVKKADYNQAILHFECAANEGNKDAQFSLGRLYGMGNEEQDPEQEEKWYRLASIQGHVEAQYNLGCLYNEGGRIKRNYKKASELFKLAANQNYHKAQYNLGVMYFKGQGIKQNYEKAEKWYCRAAFLGDNYALLDLGLMYKDGYFVEQNDTIAYALISLAADRGHWDAQMLRSGRALYFKD